jgi:hypothetical protein
MSCSSRWPAKALAPLALAAGVLVTGPAAATVHTAAPPLPGAGLAGQGTLRFFGLSVYHARLWAPPGFEADRYAEQALALELEYLRAFTAADIARRSITEMRRIGRFTAQQAAEWETALARLLPDVRPGDRLTGLYRPGQGATFLYNDRPLGSVEDPVFSRLFFGIWLAPQTSEPGLRQALTTAPVPTTGTPRP